MERIGSRHSSCLWFQMFGVDATPSNQLIRQCFPSENRYAQVCSIRPSQGGVSFALHMRRTLTF